MHSNGILPYCLCVAIILMVFVIIKNQLMRSLFFWLAHLSVMLHHRPYLVHSTMLRDHWEIRVTSRLDSQESQLSCEEEKLCKFATTVSTNVMRNFPAGLEWHYS